MHQNKAEMKLPDSSLPCTGAASLPSVALQGCGVTANRCCKTRGRHNVI